MSSREDAAFLATYRVEEFARPSLMVDVVVLTVLEGVLATLLVRRREAPQRGKWSLPGGFVGIDEDLGDAVARVLRTKAGLENLYTEQLYTFGDVGRDPRTRVVSVAYLCLVPAALATLGSKDVTWARLDVPWTGEEGGPVGATTLRGTALSWAFDHADIVGLAVQRLRGKLRWAPVGYELLGDTFALRDLQAIHEAILGHRLNKDSFRRSVLARGQVEATGALEEGVAWRPAVLYRFRTS